MSITISVTKEGQSLLDAVKSDPIAKSILLPETCDVCDGEGYVIYSCCGDDIKHNDIDLCPSCGEHCGDEREDCLDCNDGILNNKAWLELIGACNQSEQTNAGEHQNIEARPRSRGPSARSAAKTELLNSLIKTLTTIQVIVETKLKQLQ